MNRLLLILILTFSFQTFTKADDIKDFEIEGISIGSSALDFFDKEIIDKRKVDGFVYPDKSFFSITFYNKDFFKTYDAIQLHLMAEDSNYIIYSIAGRIFFENDYNGCVIKMEKILPELKTMFSNAYLQDDGTLIWTDVKGRNVKTKSYYLNLKSGADIALECYDQPKEAQIIDGLNLAIDSKEFVNFLTKF
jgi:hypothetical protein